jgi:2-polyprenyl-3-methyl-5-hydroxy-6-metoxy-1,4-benzoquinol methylase
MTTEATVDVAAGAPEYLARPQRGSLGGTRNTLRRRAGAGSVAAVPDALFSVPRLARIYDGLDPDRSDLDAYLAIVEELGARSVLDVGCGTGTLACLLAARGLDEVIGVDPAGASLDVDRAKPGAEQVVWLAGDATGLPALGSTWPR